MDRRAPKGLRLHIGLFGRRNVGKSSLLNAFTRQQVSIVSDVAGTTTDPVEKTMEILPLGPVVFIDTAGLDDIGALGELRVKRSRRILDRTDIGVIISEAGMWGDFEEQLLEELQSRTIPVIVVFNKSDLGEPPPELVSKLDDLSIPMIRTVASEGDGVLDLRMALLKLAPAEFIDNPAILADLVGPKEIAVLVVPIDKEAPKGRLILPQVQSIRDLLDYGSYCMIARDAELDDALKSLKRKPALVVTDSQAFRKVADITPEDYPLTSFSILFARYKGELIEFAQGAAAIDSLKSGDRVIIAEACSHHPIEEDIGRVKIPRWLQQHIGGELKFDIVQGHDFPDDLSPYKLVIHCGACMLNRRAMLTRQLRCRKAGIPITNYGLVIARSLGIFERALEPFPEVLDSYLEMQAAR